MNIKSHSPVVNGMFSVYTKKIDVKVNNGMMRSVKMQSLKKSVSHFIELHETLCQQN